MDEGKIVSAIPKVTRRSKYGINWDGYAHLARQTGQPVLAGKHISNSQVKSIRQYDREPFVTPEGHIAVRLRNSEIDPKDNRRYGDVYFEWIAKTPQTNTSQTDTTA